mgnify:CR=1 FL=1
MKKFFMFIALATAMVLPSQAQINFGIKGGWNLTSLSFSNSNASDGVSNKSGFFVGPTAKFTLPIVGLGIDASALYDQRMGEVKATGEKLKQQSIQIPVNARYSVGLGGAMNINKHLRLNVAYFCTLYSDYTRKTDYMNIPVTETYSRTNNVWGIGIDYKF